MYPSRASRAETRSKAKEDTKRAIHNVERVRKWEKKWVTIKDTTMKVFKWVLAVDQHRDAGKNLAVVMMNEVVGNGVFGLDGRPATENVNETMSTARQYHISEHATFDLSQMDVGSEPSADSPSVVDTIAVTSGVECGTVLLDSAENSNFSSSMSRPPSVSAVAVEDSSVDATRMCVDSKEIEHTESIITSKDNDSL